MNKQTILFLAASPRDPDQLAAGEEARAIQRELESGRERDRFKFVTSWAVEPLDLLRELRKHQPAIVHFSGRGGESPPGLYLHGENGSAHRVSGEALREAFSAAGACVRLVVLNTCYSEEQVDALLSSVPSVVGMAGAFNDVAAKSFAIGFYGGIGDGASVGEAYEQGRAAMVLTQPDDLDRARLRVRDDVEPDNIEITEGRKPGGGSDGRSPGGSSAWRSIGLGIHTAFSDGQGAYLLAMLALGAGATFLHRALQPERQHHQALTSLITQEQEPYLAEPHPMLASALVSGAPWDLCADTELLARTDDIVKDLTAAIADKLPTMALPASLKDCIDPGSPPRGPLSPSSCPPPTPDLSPALTDESVDTTLMVPSTVAMLVKEDILTRVVLDASRRIANYQPFINSVFRKSGGRLTSIYFVELSGALRFIPRWPSTVLPAHRTFAGSSYVYSALSHTLDSGKHCRSVEQSVTESYLDVARMGIVKTVCQRIKPGNKVVGTLCFDFSMPDDALCRALQKATSLFDLHLVRIDSQNRAESANLCGSGTQSLSATEIGPLEDEWLQLDSKEAAGGSSSVRMLGHNRYFGAIVKQGTDGSIIVAFGRVQHTVRGLASAAMMLLFTAIASGAIAVGVRNKARRLDLTLIKGLQVGVVKLDHRDVIVGANDRAVEIFDQPLPAFDTPKPWQPIPFGGLLHDRIAVLDGFGQLPAGPVKLVRYETLKQERHAGHSTSYYALTKVSHQIVRVSGSTFVSPDLRLHTFGTVETFIDEDHRRRVIRVFEHGEEA